MKDKQIEKLIKGEEKRVKSIINLIPSENFASKDVYTALGSVFDYKYSEGYPHKRYYGGQTYTDQLEDLAKARALKLFGLSEGKWHVNVQPHSGSPANLAVYLALVPKGGKIMGMTLSHGGHLTHGQKVSITGKMWEQVPYGVNEATEVIDYLALEELARKEKPNLIVAGFTAYPRAVNFKKFREIADACGAYLMVDMSHFAGLVAGKAYASPFPYADVVTTTTHKTLRGPRGAIIFARTDKWVEGVNGKRANLGELIDKAVFPGIQGGPHMSQVAAIAVALKEASTPAFKKYATQVVKNTKMLADTLTALGWRVVSGGTDSHLLLLDTWMNGAGLSGKDAAIRLEKEGIITNFNTIPGEKRSAFDPSGIRIGSPSETTRGKKEKDFKKIAERIDQILKQK